MARKKIHAYRRENGRVGVRNHVVILPVDDISNAACEGVANNVKGTMALPHSYGRLQFGEGHECSGARRVHGGVRRLSETSLLGEDRRPFRVATDEGKHRRRPDNDRGKGAW